MCKGTWMHIDFCQGFGKNYLQLKILSLKLSIILSLNVVNILYFTISNNILLVWLLVVIVKLTCLSLENTVSTSSVC